MSLRDLFIPLLFLPFLTTSLLQAQNIIPEPLEMIKSDGQFAFNKQTMIFFSDKDAAGEAEYLADIFNITSGFKLATTAIEPKQNYVKFLLKKDLVHLGKEGYTLEITPDGIVITAKETAGLFYASQTIKQLLPPEIDGFYPVSNLNMEVPCLKIKDIPRFPYRGYLLDVSRYFIPISDIKKTLDAMAFYKLNTFHWHLTDYQGWRLQIMQYPELTLKGSKANQTKWLFEGSNFIEDHIPTVNFYTQQEVKDLIEYADKLHINIIPEIDVPAHSIAAITAYPYLTCFDKPQQVREEKVGGLPTVFCPGKESTFSFLENVFDEVMELFPSQYIHIGADEVNKKEWEQCPLCKKRMQDEGLETLNDLQSYFVQRVEKYLEKHNRKTIGWDEILEGELNSSKAIVMSWRGINGGIKAVKSGHQAIMTPLDFCYFDYVQSADRTKEPYVRFEKVLPLSTVYSYDPVPQGFTTNEEKLILGVQANMWSNFIKSPGHAQYMTFPRICALAEIAWSMPSRKDYVHFTGKLESHYPRFDQRHISYRKPPQE